MLYAFGDRFALVAFLALFFHVFSWIRLAQLRSIWWSLPLSPSGRTQLSKLVSRLPHLRGCFAHPDKHDLTQADLALARRASRAMKDVVAHHETMEEMDRRAHALEQLPSMAEYRARLLAARLETSLEPSGLDRPRPRF